jgi:hypothetical protein
MRTSLLMFSFVAFLEVGCQQATRLHCEKVRQSHEVGGNHVWMFDPEGEQGKETAWGLYHVYRMEAHLHPRPKVHRLQTKGDGVDALGYWLNACDLSDDFEALSIEDQKGAVRLALLRHYGGLWLESEALVALEVMQDDWSRLKQAESPLHFAAFFEEGSEGYPIPAYQLAEAKSFLVQIWHEKFLRYFSPYLLEGGYGMKLVAERVSSFRGQRHLFRDLVSFDLKARDALLRRALRHEAKDFEAVLEEDCSLWLDPEIRDHLLGVKGRSHHFAPQCKMYFETRSFAELTDPAHALGQLFRGEAFRSGAL